MHSFNSGSIFLTYMATFLKEKTMKTTDHTVYKLQDSRIILNDSFLFVFLGLNFARPCVPPYQYMQYPSYVFPQAPIYPVDHRRMFEPRFYTPTWVDPQHRSQPQPQPQPQGGRRETASSEAQTEPSDAISKLMECLDKIRVGDLPCVESRELDSGVASQTSGMFSPGEESKAEMRGEVLPEVPDSGRFQSMEADGECTQRDVVDLPTKGCWSGQVEDELPLDSSSLHGECSSTAVAEDKLLSPVGKTEVVNIQSDAFATVPGVSRCGVEELLGVAQPSSSSSSFLTSSSPSRFSSSVLKDANSSTRVLQEKNEAPEEKYQILKLPFDDMMPTVGAAASQLSPPAGSYYYVSMHATERMSVLSPSLDELSSKDEMFSTDLDDADLFPKHAYPGRRLMGVVGMPPKASEEVWLHGPKRCVCTCCGKNLSKAMGKKKAALWAYRDEAADSEEEDSQYEGGGAAAEGGGGGGGGAACERPIRVLMRKHLAPRRPHTVPPRPSAWHRRGPYKDQDHDLPDQDPDGVQGAVAAGGGVAQMGGEF